MSEEITYYEEELRDLVAELEAGLKGLKKLGNAGKAERLAELAQRLELGDGVALGHLAEEEGLLAVRGPVEHRRKHAGPVGPPPGARLVASPDQDFLVSFSHRLVTFQ